MSVINSDFAVFILTHGRPDNVITVKTLRSHGYNGRIFYIVDNEDCFKNDYVEKFGSDYVIIFDKKQYADNVDEGNNFDERRTITHARNACFDIAKNLGINYFIQLDDDYTYFEYRFNSFSFHKKVKNLDFIFNSYLEFYKTTKCLSLAMAQGGDYIGGKKNAFALKQTLKRKCMNSFICSIERPFKFVGAMNEDVNTYTTLGSRGNLFFTAPNIALGQKATQSQSGGITDMYLRFGTYAKAFTTVMMMPSSVKIALMGDKNKRLHHSITWNNTVPKIISQEFKKTVN